jgi:3-methyladenine DNA glycosylase AlkD
MTNSKSAELKEIQSALERMADPAAKASFKKFVPTSQNVYGVRLPFLNELAKQYKSAKFDLVRELWNSGVFEEKLLAAKILGRICKGDPDKTLALLAQFSSEISDWAVCDTLATQGIRGIYKIKQKEIFDLAKKFVKSGDIWQRRMGIVLLTNYAKDPSLRSEIEMLIEPLASDKEKYIKKAIIWIRKDLNK